MSKSGFPPNGTPSLHSIIEGLSHTHRETATGTLRRKRPYRRQLRSLLALAGFFLPAVAQAQGVPPFDPSRLWFSGETLWQPFLVGATVPITEALDDRLLEAQTPVLVLEHPRGRVALVTEQMAYHHVAQGDLAGEPWMVSF